MVQTEFPLLALIGSTDVETRPDGRDSLDAESLRKCLGKNDITVLVAAGEKQVSHFLRHLNVCDARYAVLLLNGRAGNRSIEIVLSGAG